MAGPDLSGVVLDGRYRLVSLLGAGGMGQVYEGTHLSLERRVAIKVLPSHLSEDERFRARFAREARAAGRISHRNVVQIMDYGESPDGPVYFVMEFLDGRDLGELLREEGRLEWPRARHLLLQAISALGAAHAHEIIHRDIKPGNCFVLDLPHEKQIDVVKLLDFGIAKVLTEIESEGGTLVKPLTGTGEIVGTASYMAPEQARCEQLDARSDIYSLGIMAYEMLTGRVPFAGVNPFHVVTRHIYDRPEPLRRSVPDILPDVEDVVLRAIAKEPIDRFQSMAEFEAAILAVSNTPLESVQTRVFSTSGPREAVEGERGPLADGKSHSPTVVLGQPVTNAHEHDSVERFENAETPGPLVLMPRFGKPYPMAAKDEAPLDEAPPTLDDGPIAPPEDEAEVVEDPSTDLRIGPDSVEGSSSEGAPDDETAVIGASAIARLESVPEPVPILQVTDRLVAENADPTTAEYHPPPEATKPGPPIAKSRRPFSAGRTSLLALAILLTSGATVAFVALPEGDEGASGMIRNAALERVVPSTSNVIGEASTTIDGMMSTGRDTGAVDENASTSGAASDSTTDDTEATSATGSDEEASTTGDVEAANITRKETTTIAEVPLQRVRRRPSPESKICEEQQYIAGRANRESRFADLYRHTKSMEHCWPPAKKVEWARFYITSLLKTNRIQMCVRFGEDAQDAEVVGIAKKCKDRIAE